MAESRLQRLQRRIDRERRRYEHRPLAFRVLWVLAGVILLAAGLAMVVFPGPAFVVIPIGLAMLSFEFAWAQRLLDKGLESGKAAQELAENATGQQKALAGVAAVFALAAVAAAVILVIG
jgi:uncharacterized protein (TIGR02611 family)